MLPRPKIPEPLRRRVLIEAGHRCAIPTCKEPTTEIAHIIPWAEVKKHEFDNLIALCPNCHARYDRKKEIDRKSMIHYKLNLSIINSRYGDLERRVLEWFSVMTEPRKVTIPKALELLLTYLVKDGLIEKNEFHSALGDYNYYELTEKGKIFIEKWINADSVE